MSSRPFELGLGQQVRFEGLGYELIARTASTVTLKRLSDGQVVDAQLEHVLNSPGFGLLAEEEDGQSEVAASTLFDLVPEAEREFARWRLAHLLEAQTGYQSGHKEDALEHEPRPEYDPRVTRTQRERFANKAHELKARNGITSRETVTPRTLERWAADHDRQGLFGLCDQRKTQVRNPVASLDERYLTALKETLQAQEGFSDVAAKKVRFDVERLLDERFGPGEVKRPGKTRFHAVYNALTRHDGPNAKARRSNKARPRPQARQVRATRPGEIVQLDCTRADIHVLDRETGKVGRPEISIAVDAFAKTVVGARFTMASSKGVDAALLLHDVLTPKRADAGWPEHAKWQYSGVPRELVVSMGEPTLSEGDVAGIPFVMPETVVIDHGRMYMSQTFLDGAQSLGISVQPAPPGTPNYKGVVESFFQSLNAGLLQHLTGYSGPNVLARGHQVEAEAVLFLDEFADLFFDWVASVYHVQPHQGCRVTAAPKQHVTPNQMFDQGVATSGFIMALPDPERVLGLLPLQWCRPTPIYGVQVGKLRYYDEALEPWMNVESPYPGKRFEHPIRFDPRDRSRVWFQDPERHSWHALLRLGADDPHQPFPEALVSWAKRTLLARRERVNPESLNDELNDFLRRHKRGDRMGPAELAVKGQLVEAQRQVEQDIKGPQSVSVVAEEEPSPVAEEADWFDDVDAAETLD